MRSLLHKSAVNEFEFAPLQALALEQVCHAAVLRLASLTVSRKCLTMSNPTPLLSRNRDNTAKEVRRL
jgi:hypothetical protein